MNGEFNLPVGVDINLFNGDEFCLFNGGDGVRILLVGAGDETGVGNDDAIEGKIEIIPDNNSFADSKPDL